MEPEDVGEYKLSATYETDYDEEEFMIIVNSTFIMIYLVATCIYSVFTHTHTYVHIVVCIYLGG